MRIIFYQSAKIIGIDEPRDTHVYHGDTHVTACISHSGLSLTFRSRGQGHSQEE